MGMVREGNFKKMVQGTSNHTCVATIGNQELPSLEAEEILCEPTAGVEILRANVKKQVLANSLH